MKITISDYGRTVKVTRRSLGDRLWRRVMAVAHRRARALRREQDRLIAEVFER